MKAMSPVLNYAARVACLLCLSSVGAIHAAMAADNAKHQDGLRISAMYDRLRPISAMVRDFCRAYGVNVILVLGEEDAAPNHSASYPARGLYIKDKPEREFFRELTSLFPSYLCTQDLETACWFIFPADGQGAIFQEAAVFCPRQNVSGIKAVEDCMSTISNSFQLRGYNPSPPPAYFGFWLNEPSVLPMNVVGELPVGANVRWKAIAKVMKQIPRSFLTVCMTRAKELSPYPWPEFPKNAPTNCFWALRTSMDLSTLPDRDIVGIMTNLTSQIPYEVDSQLVRMDPERLWRLYKMVDASDLRTGIFLVAIQNPMVMYSDTGIRMAIDNVRSSRCGVIPMHVLLRHCYSRDIVDLISWLIATGSPEWKGHVYYAIDNAPAPSISDAQRNEWLQAMADGAEYALEKEVDSWTRPNRGRPPPLDRDVERATMKKALAAMEVDPNVRRGVELGRQSAQKQHELLLGLLGVDTNRSLAWAKVAAGFGGATNDKPAFTSSGAADRPALP